MKKIIIIGTGGFAREILFLLDEMGKFEQVAGFMEPDEIWNTSWQNKMLMDKPVFPMSSQNSSKNAFVIGIGDPIIRKKVTTQLDTNADFPVLIHPNAAVSRWVEIDKGAIITAGCVVTTQIILGAHAHLNLCTTIGHDCRINDFFTTAPGVNISGNCNIDSQVYFGTGSATRQGINICANVTIGMGAMVVKDIVEPGVYIGIPAIKK